MTPANVWAKRILNTEADRRGNYCQNVACAFTNFQLTFAHVRRTGLRGEGRGLTSRAMDLRRNPDAYALLCWDCHHDFDYGRVDSIVLTIHHPEEVLCQSQPRISSVNSLSATKPLRKRKEKSTS